MHDRKLQELCFGLNALIAGLAPAVQHLRRCSQDVAAVADAAEGLAELSRVLLAQLGQSPIPPARPELRAVPSPGKDGS